MYHYFYNKKTALDFAKKFEVRGKKILLKFTGYSQ
jgi:hypothetical protein